MTERESAYQEAIHILQLGEQLDFRNVAYRLAKLDPELAENPLLFPDDESSARLRSFATLTEDVEAKFDEEFSAITGA